MTVEHFIERMTAVVEMVARPEFGSASSTAPEVAR
jgi:hypothetical protein